MTTIAHVPLDKDQSEALAALERDLDAIAGDGPSDALAETCEVTACAFREAFSWAGGPDDSLWRRVYALGLDVLAGARRRSRVSMEGAAALRRFAAFMFENRDLG
jgi:hypothetical protein